MPLRAFAPSYRLTLEDWPTFCVVRHPQTPAREERRQSMYMCMCTINIWRETIGGRERESNLLPRAGPWTYTQNYRYERFLSLYRHELADRHKKPPPGRTLRKSHARTRASAPPSYEEADERLEGAAEPPEGLPPIRCFGRFFLSGGEDFCIAYSTAAAVDLTGDAASAVLG